MDEHRPSDPARWPDGAICTLGHSTSPIEAFLGTLRAYAIRQLADIRSIPRSRRNPQFNGDVLAGTLAANGIVYHAMPGLGGLRHAHAHSPNMGWHNESFRGYADYMQTPAFAAALDTLIETRAAGRVGIMCAEAVPWRCHRSLVADALSVRGVPVIEILSAENARPHRLTPFARVCGTQITYPPEQGALL